MAKVVSRAGRPKVREDTNISVKTRPVKNYQDIKCPFTIEERAKYSHPCFLVCGLLCARNCCRYPDRVCEGCPCLKAKEDITIRFLELPHL